MKKERGTLHSQPSEELQVPDAGSQDRGQWEMIWEPTL